MKIKSKGIPIIISKFEDTSGGLILQMPNTPILNILYGVQATGNGHITRSREMVTTLKQRGHRVQAIVSGRPESELWSMEAFRPYEVMQGLTFKTEKGRVRKFKTVINTRPLQMLKDINNFDASNIDLVITDFEPISARIAKKHHIPSIGLGHQYAFEHPVPHSLFNYLSSTFINKFAPVDIGVGLHWHHFNFPILPPIVPQLDSVDIHENGKVLVYLPFEDHNFLITILRNITEINFTVYTKASPPGESKNVTVKAISRAGFKKDLIESEAVLCNAGFELPSEALSLGKKLLIKPLKGQPEQTSNAEAMRELELGFTTKKLSENVIREWFNKEAKVKVDFPKVVPALADWIEQGHWDHLSLNSLTKELWEQATISQSPSHENKWWRQLNS